VLAGPPSSGPDASLPPKGDQWGEAHVIVSGVPVVTVPRRHEEGGQEGALVVLATDRAQATALAGAAAPLSVTITGS
jgi:hypothetical protein